MRGVRDGTISEMAIAPIWLTVFLGLGLVLILLHYVPAPFLSPFSSNRDEMKASVSDRFKRKLRLAGYHYNSPSLFILGIALFSAVIGLLAAAALHTILVLPLGPIIVIAGTFWHLNSRERNAINRASNEIIPFLRNIEAAVRAQMAPPLAYRRAVEKTSTLRRYLEPSIAEMISGVSFSQALKGTTERLPLRTWSIFVRQMELHERAGGPLADALAETVRHLDMIIQLQSDARAQYAAQQMQMRIITLISFGGTAIFGLVIDPSVTAVLFTTLYGFIALFVGLTVMGGGLWFGRKQLHDISRKLNF